MVSSMAITDYSTMDFSITPMGKTVTMVDLEGESIEVQLSVVHAQTETILKNLPEKIQQSIAPGSLGYVTGMSQVWQKDFNGEWVGVEF